jgi:glucose-1-phosphate cytidylyltransferase
MKAVILAGGKGTRISEESKIRPKPMVEIGGRPILWHIMKWYEKYGVNDFVICCGYKGDMIKKYFLEYVCHYGNVCFDMKKQELTPTRQIQEKWRVTLADTGWDTLTAGRILRIRDYVDEEPFFLTYGDGVADLNLDALLSFHKKHGKTVTISVTKPQGRFGGVAVERNGMVRGFREKAREDQTWVNIGYMVMQPEVFEYLGDGSTMLEAEPFERLVEADEMAAYKHPGFWSPMDNIHDRDYLQELWNAGEVVWR